MPEKSAPRRRGVRGGVSRYRRGVVVSWELLPHLFINPLPSVLFIARKRSDRVCTLPTIYLG
eukprot:scaffold17673_cov28-Attheya_sp.AAC.1